VIGYTDVCERKFDWDAGHAVHEDPRVTKPYTEASGGDRDALGERSMPISWHDVRLTQGGEPTFVSVDDMEGPEWNYTALSPKKRELGETLLRRLAARFATWRISAFGAREVVSGRAAAALGDRHVVAHGRASAVDRPRIDRRYARQGKRRSRAGQRFAAGLAQRLGLDASCVITAFEDVPKLLATEAALPSNADPLGADLANPDERARLARLLLQGLDRPAGVRASVAPGTARQRTGTALAQQPLADPA
jgi:uncharacterized protein (DUF2126 family)